MIVVLDLGFGNIGSILNMLKKIGVSAMGSSAPKDIQSADRLILPGVGRFDSAMKCLNESQLIPLLEERVLEKKTPILGICLGMQLLTNHSEEGDCRGLGWIKGKTVAFNSLPSFGFSVPHMGWGHVSVSTPSPLTEDLYPDSRFYFVHSYFVRVENQTNSILRTSYGVPFESGIQKDNIFGVQFHPEKSHKYGMQLLKAFVGVPGGS